MDNYRYKYQKYKKKYITIKQKAGYVATVNDINMDRILSKANDNDIIYHISKLIAFINNDSFYKTIYEKMTYMPLIEGIQIIILDYMTLFFKNLYPANINYRNVEYHLDDKRTRRIIRKRTHLHDMLNNDYYQHIMYDDHKITNINPIKLVEWRNWFICPTNVPSYFNHLFMISKKQKLASFFFDTPEILHDMYDLHIQTNYSIYNNVVLGSIWEIAHCHILKNLTPIEIFLNQSNYSKIDIINLPMFKLFYINDRKKSFTNCYVFDIDKIIADDFFKNYDFQTLFDTQTNIINEEMYYAQIGFFRHQYQHIIRFIVFFRKTKEWELDIHRKINEKFYDDLFGTKYVDFIGDRISLFNVGYVSIYPSNSYQNKKIDDFMYDRNYENYIKFIHQTYENIFFRNNIFETGVSLLVKNMMDEKKYNNDDIFIINNNITFDQLKKINLTDKKNILEYLKLLLESNKINMEFLNIYHHPNYNYDKVLYNYKYYKRFEYTSLDIISKILSDYINNYSEFYNFYPTIHSIIKDNDKYYLLISNYIHEYHPDILSPYMSLIAQYKYIKMPQINKDTILGSVFYEKRFSDYEYERRIKITPYHTIIINYDKYQGYDPVFIYNNVNNNLKQNILNINNQYNIINNLSQLPDDIFQPTYHRSLSSIFDKLLKINAFKKIITTNDHKVIAKQLYELSIIYGDNILKKLSIFPKITIEKNTYFTSAINSKYRNINDISTSNIFNNSVDLKSKYIGIDTLWTLSNFNLPSSYIDNKGYVRSNDFGNINTGLKIAFSQRYIGNNSSQLGRLIIFKNFRAVDLYAIGFDKKSRLEYIRLILDDFVDINLINMTNYIIFEELMCYISECIGIPGYIGAEYPGNIEFNKMNPSNYDYDNGIEYVHHNILNYANIIAIYFNDIESDIHSFILDYDQLFLELKYKFNIMNNINVDVDHINNYKFKYDRKLDALEYFIMNYNDNGNGIYQQKKYKKYIITYDIYGKISYKLI